ncbi:MAG: argininosuccinate synthase [Planctomycetes bacterium]|nr:argininosuccinate synthase [Planctomycetota bacterium]
MDKVILAYSGGLHTSVCVHWLRREKGLKVIAVAVDLGQKDSLRQEADRAIAAGAESVHIIDKREQFVTDYIFKALKANACTQSGYLLTTALARPLICRELVKRAREENCRVIAHGARGNRNDVIRFRNCISPLAPEMQIITPVAEWRMKTRRQEIDYARRNRIPIQDLTERTLGYDKNLWGTTLRCGGVESTWNEVKELPYQMTFDPEDAPDTPDVVEIEFSRGLPVSLDGERLGPLELIDRLNKLGGRHGVGRLDTVEDTLSGTRTRNVYEAPGATILYSAHEALELLVLRRLLVRYKGLLGRKYADLIFRGEWFDEFRECLDAFFDKSQERVTGTVRAKLYKGSCSIVGRESEFSLFTQLDAAAIDHMAE